ncbi:MAG: hypothetical protein HYT15_02915 [Candidatus Magasanikbacteria bacterium]|nr:hypothetical protein [Candidatus Magasanikbacteria bacterium]
MKTLLYTLQNNGIELDDIQIFEGEISPEMIRKTSYITVVIEKINRIVQVCDEEGNASYVFDMAHLQELGVNVPDVNTMSKEEKNTFLLQNRQAGQRFIQGPKWAAILESLLYEDFKELQLSPGDSFENDQELPQVSKIELDPWKGFWTDQEGKHWGPITTIIKKATYKRSYRSLSDMAVSLELEKKIVVDVFGHKRAAYSFEDFINTAEVKKYLESPQVDDAGEWEGFWIDPDTNKHYAALNIIADKLGLSKDFLSSLMAMATIHIKEIRRRKGGKFVNAYAYEDVVKLPAVREILELPIVEKAGEWKNFWIDPETGNHFGTVLVLANKLEISYKFVEEIIKSQGVNLVSKIVRCPPNMKAVVYPYELISENDLIKERISIPKAEVSGDWEGFYVDEKSDHWASINVLSAKLQISGKLIKKLIEEHSFQSKNIFNQKVVEAYKYEDISGVSRIIELREAKQVEAQGEWRGFYISPSSNEHWGPIKTIANKLKVSVRQVQKIITEKNLFSVSIKTAALGKGGIYQAYKFEDVVSG